MFIPLLRSALNFQEFDPRCYREGSNVNAMLLRYVLIASVVVIPVAVCLIQYVFRSAPILIYMMAAVGALYAPAILLVRRARVTVTPNYEFCVSRPKTIDLGHLVDAACGAAAYFLLAGFVVLALGK